MNRNALLKEFMNKIDYEFRDIELLNVALTHSSYDNERKNYKRQNNERLEFLGDAILDAVISQFLYKKFEDLEEGDLTRMRSSIVCENSLADCGKKYNIGKYFLLGKGEENTGGRNRTSIIANTVEAVYGAVFIDGGYEKTAEFIIETLGEVIEEAVDGKRYSDYKTALQELIQKKKNSEISYETVKEEGPDHEKTFYIEVTIDNIPAGVGSGKNKKEAEQRAARDALRNNNLKY